MPARRTVGRNTGTRFTQDPPGAATDAESARSGTKRQSTPWVVRVAAPERRTVVITW